MDLVATALGYDTYTHAAGLECEIVATGADPNLFEGVEIIIDG